MKTIIDIPSIKFDFKNKNKRIYVKENFQPHIQKFLSKGPVFGCFECDLIDGKISLAKISHTIDNISIKNNRLEVTITILSTPYGKLLQELYDCGEPICLSPHSYGYVDDNYIVHINELVSFHIVLFEDFAFTSLCDIRKMKLEKIKE